MKVKWQDNLNTGVDIIDNQHREMIVRINNLLEANREGKGAEKIEEMLGFLREYVENHFRDEEEIMEKYAWPKLEEHKRIHANFVESVRKMEQEFQERGAKMDLAMTLNTKVFRWWVSHILMVDQEMTTFIKEKKAETGS